MRYELTDDELLAIQQDHLDHANREILRMEAEIEQLPERDRDKTGHKHRLAAAKAHKEATVKRVKEIQKRAGKPVDS